LGRENEYAVFCEFAVGCDTVIFLGACSVDLLMQFIGRVDVLKGSLLFLTAVLQ
jgi:hypothetical protein